MTPHGGRAAFALASAQILILVLEVGFEVHGLVAHAPFGTDAAEVLSGSLGRKGQCGDAGK